MANGTANKMIVKNAVITMLFYETSSFKDPILQNFAQLKNALFKCEELSTLDPNVFLSPFLEVIRSEDTSGPITGIALTSISKFLSYGLVVTTSSDNAAAAAAVENIAGKFITNYFF